jgi:hypothetical protein
MGTVARSAVRSTTKEREPGGGVKGVEITGAVVEAGGMSPHACRVSVPAPNPINLMKSLRVILFLEVMLSFQFIYQSMTVVFPVYSYCTKKS